MNHCYKRTTTFLLFEMKLTRCWQNLWRPCYKRHRNIETALFAVPEVVCYKGSNISYQIAKKAHQNKIYLVG